MKRLALIFSLLCCGFLHAQTIPDLPNLSEAPNVADSLYIWDASAGALKEITIPYLFTSPTLVTPTLGVATGTSWNGLTLTSSTGTFTLTNGKTFAVTHGLTLSGTDSTVMTFPSTSATIARTDAANTFTGTHTFGALVSTTSATVGAASGTTGSILFKGTTSGTITLKSADAAGTYTLTLPTTDGDADQVLKTDGSGVLSWVASSSGAVATDTIFDAKGDLAVGTGSNTAAKLTVGANGTILVANSGETTGLEWTASPTLTTINATTTNTSAFNILDSIDQSHGLGFIVASDLAANKTFTYTGAFNFGMTLTADTAVTFPTSGTLLTTTGAGTGLTALNGENLQDDTVDDDSLDFGTGADQISAGDLPVADTGSIFTGTDIEAVLLELAKVPTKATATSYTIGTTDARELYGGVIYVTGAATITIPAVAAGASFTVITVGAVAVSVDPNASDLIYLDGTALSDGDKVTNTSTTGDIIVFTYYDGTGWYATSSGWTDGN